MALRNLDRYKVEIASVEGIIGHVLALWQREQIGDLLENVQKAAIASFVESVTTSAPDPAL